PSSVIPVERNRTLLTSSFHQKKPATANRSKLRTIQRKFPTISCSIFTGDKSILPRRTDSSPTLARVIAPPFFTATMKRKELRRLQKRNSRARENSVNQS